MNISLTPTLEEFVHQKVASGLYNSASEVVRESLRLLEEKEKYKQIKLQELRQEIQKGIDSADKGDLISGKEAMSKLKKNTICYE